MKKRAFSLIEILISITLFTIVLFFLYDTLNITTESNKFYSNKLEIKQNKNNLRKIFFLDFINKVNEDVKIIDGRNKNSILSIQTYNTYHHPFNNYVTYLLTQKGNLVRIESRETFNELALNDLFFESASIDVLESKVKKVKITESNQKYYFYIEYMDSTTLLFSY